MMSTMVKVSRTLALGGATGGAGLTAAAAYNYNKLKKEESLLPTQELYKFKHKLSNEKQVIIIGGGVVGVTAAYKLSQKGHAVVLLEPRSEPGKECSACAAGGMQRSNPVVDKSTWMAVIHSMSPFGGYSFFHLDFFKTLSDPFFLRWIMTFTKTSLFPSKDQGNLQKEMLLFTDYAVQDMLKMMKDENDEMAKKSGYNPRGSLSLSYDLPSPAEEDASTKKNPTGGKTHEPYTQINGKDITTEEPSILHQKKQPTTAKYEFESAAASSERFTEELADRCAKNPSLDVTFLYNTTVKGITTSISTSTNKQRVVQLKTNRGIIHVPENGQVLVAAGAWTPHICSLMDLYAPVYPLKGYAMSVSANEALKDLKPKDLPSRIVSDKYIYTSRLGDEIRITSIGEFSGWSTQPTPHVEEEFRLESIRQFPQLGSFISKAKVICGHRPYVNDGILLLGRVPSFDNLLVSCGPGSNGWKLAMGSGEIVERLVSDQTEEEISKELGFDAHSFSPAGRVLHSPFFSKLCRGRWGV